MITRTPLFADIMIYSAGIMAFIAITAIFFGDCFDEEKMKKKTKDVWFVVGATTTISTFFCVSLGLFSAMVLNNHVALSELSDKIHVEGEKVIFEPIANKFTPGSDYDDSNVNNENHPNAKVRNVFITEYDENFDSITLTAQNGYKYKLNYEDTKFLLEKGARK